VSDEENNVMAADSALVKAIGLLSAERAEQNEKWERVLTLLGAAVAELPHKPFMSYALAYIASEYVYELVGDVDATAEALDKLDDVTSKLYSFKHNEMSGHVKTVACTLEEVLDVQFEESEEGDGNEEETD
jgi:hypothetical protein